jgi:hypothetical protein
MAWLSPTAFAVLALGAASPSVAQLAIPWSTLDGGGGRVAAGDFVLDATIAQLDAAPAVSQGGYTLAGGF